MKQTLYKALPNFLLHVYHIIKFDVFDCYGMTSYSQEGEDMVLRRIFELRKTGFYVDVGAHHPKRFSNTYYFYRRGWKGINIDPNPESMHLFRKYRIRDINLMCGISDQPGELTYYMFNESALNTFNKELAETRQLQSQYQVIGTAGVKVERLESVLRDNLPEGTCIDFMSVDAEGHDLNVIRSNNWDKFRPRCLVVEALESSIQDVLRSEMHEYVASQGYALFAKTFNSIFYIDRSTTGAY